MPYRINRTEFSRLSSSDGAKRTGQDSAVIRCPAHEDRDPSCSVKYEGGNLLVHCHAGCDFKEIIDGLKAEGYELEQGERERKKVDSRKPKPTPIRKVKQKLVITREQPLRVHVYTDEKGTPQYRQVKYASGWRREHFGEDGRLYSGSGDKTPTLYRLPELVKAIQQRKTILIHEGEKDADATNERSDGSIFATTSGGAQTWKDSFVGLFKVENPPKVVVIGDEDEPNKQGKKPGDEFAQAVLKSFVDAGLPVARYQLPKLFNGNKIKDISDFYEAGGRFEKIKRIALTAHTVTKFELEPVARNIRVGSLLERLSWAQEDERPVLPGVFEVGGVVQIVGASKARKSFFALQMAIASALGEDFLGLVIEQPRRVLYLNYELEPRWMNHRLGRMVEGMQVDCSKHSDNLRVLDLELAPPTIDLISRVAKEYAPEMIVIDPIYPLIAGDENNTDSWHRLLQDIKGLARGQGCAVVYVHHDPKGDSSQRKLVDRGSGSGIQARHYDAGIYLGPHNDGESTILEFVLRNYAPIEAQTIQFERGHFVAASHIPPEAPQPNNAKKGLNPSEYVELCSRLVAEAASTSEPHNYRSLIEAIQKEVSLGERRAQYVIKATLEAEQINKRREGKSTFYYPPGFSLYDLF